MAEQARAAATTGVANSNDCATGSRVREPAMSDEEAVTVAERDIAEERVLAESMAHCAALSPAYRRALSNLAPDLMQRVRNVEKSRVEQREEDAATWSGPVAREKAKADAAEYLHGQNVGGFGGDNREIVARIAARSTLNESYWEEFSKESPVSADAIMVLDRGFAVLREFGL